MAKDLCKFDLLMVTQGYVYINSIGMMIYSRCPNFNLYFSTNLADATGKARRYNPEVFIIDENLRKEPAFRSFLDVLKQNGGIVFYLTGTDAWGRPVMGAAKALTLPTTISGEDLERRLGYVAEHLLWKKLASAGLLQTGTIKQKGR